MHVIYCLFFFFFNDTATTEIYTLSLHDALPISVNKFYCSCSTPASARAEICASVMPSTMGWRSEEHTSELQSLTNLVCRLLLEKKKTSERGAVVAYKHQGQDRSIAVRAAPVLAC